MTTPETKAANGEDDDTRWITINGRRWRASDPSIPLRLRQELVDQLMSARRDVAAAMKSGSSDDLRAARWRVNAAKVALGERGTPWWETPTDDGLRERIAATITTLTRHRAPDRTICPSDVARVIGGPSWRRHMDVVRSVAAEMAGAGRVEIMQHGKPVVGGEWRGPIRIRSLVADSRV